MTSESYYKWRDADDEKPKDYALVEVEDEFGKKQCGWWAEDHWDYGKRKMKGRVLSWRYERMQHF